MMHSTYQQRVVSSGPFSWLAHGMCTVQQFTELGKPFSIEQSLACPSTVYT